ncbi:hypothetical protein [Legionella bononiensis]|uniref:Effector protein B, substrate of the Dot/Icm secretion system n=1 Tax=Legionella bononiensis TaxID=2793102 RepID=A0ABS1WB25_9GAMM|nr:hypothetical protein [Legionella bononiensis]MBL7480202.1 hypothetical protein [Legionella bononiensis]MBL7526566.1 hypothetical protein [Legionella bononiensis]MBL7562940.1 hypothetical protein [Legionella bononiensis]
MPFPKLSAVLNNCPLHALTPEIKDEILKFGENEHYNNQHRAGYINLKNKFAAFYGFDPSEFTWNKFAGILSCYNAFDIQIILGPVLRSLMKDPMSQDEFVPGVAMTNDMTTEEYINSMTEIQPHTSRYASLAPDEVYKYVSKDLGLSLTYHPQEGKVTNFETPHELATVHIFHQGGLDGAQAGGHWERTDKGQESLNVQNHDDTQLNGVIQLLGENTGVNPFGFELLKKHIQINARTLEEHNESVQLEYEFAEINIAATQILKYISNINSVPKVYAVRLLGNGLSEITRRFIEQYEFVEVEPYQIFERWIRALDEFKPQLNEEEQQVLKQLRVPVPQTLFPVEPEKTRDEELLSNEELAQILRDIERFENEEKNQRASEQLARELAEEEELHNLLHENTIEDTSEQLARQLQDEERLAQEEEERNQRASEQLAQRLAMESEHQNVEQIDHDPDTSEQLVKQLQDEERLAQEEEERNQRASEQLAQRLAMESEHQNVEQIDHDPDTTEQLARHLQDEERLAQEEEERNQRASEQLALKPTAKPTPLHNSILDRSEESQRETKLRQDRLQPMKLLEAKQSFQKHLDSLKDKMDDLAKRRNEKISNPVKFDELDKAWNAANTLHTEIARAGDLYFSNPKPQTYEQFEQSCKALIDTAHTKLDKHRGWSEFLVNFALGILTLGIGLVIKGAINLAMNHSFFFVHKTKSSELLDDIENDINNSAPTA